MDLGQVVSVLAVALAWILKNKTRVNNGLVVFIVTLAVFLTRLGAELATPAAHAGTLSGAVGGLLAAAWHSSFADAARAALYSAVVKGFGRLMRDPRPIVDYYGGASNPKPTAGG